MPSFQPSTVRDYSAAFHGPASHAYGELTDSQRTLMITFVKRNPFWKIAGGAVIYLNTVSNTGKWVIDYDGKASDRSISSSDFDKYLELAYRGVAVPSSEAKRMQEDAGRKYKTAAVRVKDKLVGSVWKMNQGKEYEVTASYILIRDTRGVAGKGSKIDNDDKQYKELAELLNNAYEDGDLTYIGKITTKSSSSGKKKDKSSSSSADSSASSAYTASTYDPSEYSYSTVAPPAPATTAPPAEDEGKKKGITSSPYFWPGVILGTTAVGASIYFFVIRK